MKQIRLFFKALLACLLGMAVVIAVTICTDGVGRTVTHETGSGKLGKPTHMVDTCETKDTVQ